MGKRWHYFQDVERVMTGGRGMLRFRRRQTGDRSHRGGGGSGKGERAGTGFADDDEDERAEKPERGENGKVRRRPTIEIPEIEDDPLADPARLEFKEPEDITGGIEKIREYAVELKKRDQLRGDEMVKMAAALKQMHEQHMRVVASQKTLARDLPRGDGPVNLRFLSGRAKKGLYRYLMTTDPERLGYGGMMDGLSSLTPQMRTFVERHAADDATRSRVLELQAANDIVLIVDAVKEANQDSGYAQMPRAHRIKRLRCYREFFKPLAEEFRDVAMDTQTSGEGLEWVPTILSSQLKTLIYAELLLAGYFDWATMPGPIWDNPVEGADAIAYLVAEALDDPAAAGAKPTASVVGTRKMTLNAVKMAARVVISTETEEDLIIPAVPHVLMRLARALARGRENAIVNGQKTSTIDTADVPGATDVRKAWDGLRFQQKSVGASMEVDLGGALNTLDGLANMKGLLREYGQNSADLVWVTGYSGFVRLLTLKDALGGNFAMSAQQIGNPGTFRTGVLAQALGTPVVVSQFMREDLNASGIFDNVTVTKTAMLLVNTRTFQGGERRAQTVRRYNELKAETDQILLMGSWRGDFKKVNYAGTQRFVALGKNIASY